MKSYEMIVLLLGIAEFNVRFSPEDEQLFAMILMLKFIQNTLKLLQSFNFTFSTSQM